MAAAHSMANSLINPQKTKVDQN